MAYTRTVQYRPLVSFWYYTDYKYRDGPSGSVTWGRVIPKPLVLDWVKSGSSVPGYKSLIATHQNATSAYSKDQVRYEVEPLMIHVIGTEHYKPSPPFAPWDQQNLGVWDTTVSGIPLTGGILGNKPAHLTISTNVGNRALSKILKRIRDDQQHFSGLTFLGEFREAASMIRRPASALRAGISSYLNGIVSNKARWMRGAKRKNHRKVINDAVAGSWLEYSFGWQPLISDVKAGAEAIARFQNDVRLSRVSGYDEAQDTFAYGPSVLFDSDWGETLTLSSPLDSTTKSCRFVAGLDCRPKVLSQGVDRLLELSGFQLKEFIPTAWELVPWSFMVDYLTNIGDILEAGVTDTSNVIWTSRTDKEETVRSVSYTLFGQDYVSVIPYMSFKYLKVHLPRSRIVRTTLSRTSPGSLGVPSFELQHPFGSIGKVANIIALWRQSQNRFVRGL
jgi:hypothetical protein